MKTKILHLLCACSLLLAFSACERPKGFTLKKIQSYYDNDSRWETTPPSPSQQATLKDLFAHPFTYLGSGNHCYAFLSEDGQYVLKFFKQKHMRTQSFIDFIPMPAKMLLYPKKKYLRRKGERDKSFTSYKIAYEHLKKETGLFYLHLNKTDLFHQEVTLIDQNGEKQIVPIDQMEFLIQKKAQVGYKRLDTLFSLGKREDALESIASLLTVITRRMEKGYFDKDLQFFKNFGFIGNQAIEIDIGELRPLEKRQSATEMRAELTEVSHQLLDWTVSHHPDYESDVATLINDMINQVRE
ncbi:hypothetical protein [Simkania sp.]|uniref:hypothetical protein n=1 Tax=Simkania sp. TaxID=34094 RepID=UPI003B52605B